MATLDYSLTNYTSISRKEHLSLSINSILMIYKIFMMEHKVNNLFYYIEFSGLVSIKRTFKKFQYKVNQ